MIAGDPRKRFRPWERQAAADDWAGHPPLGWIPVDSSAWNHVIRWVKVGDTPLALPFFMDTIPDLRSGRNPVLEHESLLNPNRAEQTWGSEHPVGIIFHASRCGSTLIANPCER
jgi:hypothetical protein